MSRRYKLVPYKDLPKDLQRTARSTYCNGVEWIPPQEYAYPIKKDGTLARAARRGPSQERAKELKDAYDVRKVMES